MILRQQNENFASGEFIQPNAKGERIKFTFEKLEDYATTKQWFDSGYTKTQLKKWWSVQVYVYLPDGTCVGRYNPMESQILTDLAMTVASTSTGCLKPQKRISRN